MTWVMSGPRQGSGVAPALCQPSAHPAHGVSPTCSATATALARSCPGYGSSTSSRSGSECAVNTTLTVVVGPGTASSEASASTTAAERNDEVGGLEVPVLDGGGGQPVPRGGLGEALGVVADAERRVVRGQHQADEALDRVGPRSTWSRRPR